MKLFSNYIRVNNFIKISKKKNKEINQKGNKNKNYFDYLFFFSLNNNYTTYNFIRENTTKILIIK